MLGSGFVLLCVCLGFTFCVVFRVSLDHFVVVLDLVSAKRSQKVIWKKRVQSGLSVPSGT